MWGGGGFKGKGERPGAILFSTPFFPLLFCQGEAARGTFGEKKSLDRDSYLGKAVRFLYLELGSINRSDM